MKTIIFAVLISLLTACEPPCNTVNCSYGCCDAENRCQKGDTQDVCGLGGTECNACLYNRTECKFDTAQTWRSCNPIK